MKVFVICACAILGQNDVALVNSYSSEAPKLWLKLKIVYAQIIDRCQTIHLHVENRKYAMSRIVDLFTNSIDHALGMYSHYRTRIMWQQTYFGSLVKNSFRNLHTCFFIRKRSFGVADKCYSCLCPETKLFMTCCINRRNSSQLQNDIFSIFTTRPANESSKLFREKSSTTL